MKARAAVAEGPGKPFIIRSVELEMPRENEILVAVVATGVCHTDMVMRDGLIPVPMPAVLGHEGAGIVKQVGRAVTKVRPGDSVVITFNSCGHCPSCVDREIAYCHEFFPRNFGGSRPDGTSALTCDGAMLYGNIFGQSSFADHVLCTERNAIKVPDDVPIELLGPLACGIQTGAGAVFKSTALRSGQTIAIFGMGTVGLSAVMASKLVGAAKIIAVDINAERLSLARELGAGITIDSRKVNSVEEILRSTGFGVDVALDATGVPKVIEDAVRSLAPRGMCGVIGASPPGSTMRIDLTSLLSGGRSVRGIVEGDSDPDTFISELITLFRDGKFPFDRLIKFYSFEDINTALSDSEQGHTIKSVVRFN